MLTFQNIYFITKDNEMNNLFKTLIAGYGAKKLGGGCFSTVLIFILIYWALGNCGSNNNNNNNSQQRTGYVQQPIKVSRG